MDAGQGGGEARTLGTGSPPRETAALIEALRRENDGLRRRIVQLEAAEPDDDRVTGLVRREVVIDRLRHCLLRSARTSEQVAVLYCDLDGFKLVNDVFGHESGDSVLAEVAARLRHLVRPYDTVARFGGDEFVILLENIGHASDAVAVAQRVVDAISNTIALPDAHANVGISVGVAMSIPGETVPEALIARADAAMYEAKHGGKGRVELFGADLDVRLTDRRELGNDLRFALEDGHLELWYRPVVSLDTGRIVSVEGSVRWNHPTRGLLGPDVFVPIAYATGHIESIDEWALTTAAADMSAWRSDGRDLVAWITVSSRMLRRDHGVGRMLSILAAPGADARRVGIEVAETSVMQDFADTVAALRALHDGQVRVALDNFCGQLTVPQLHHLRPQTVKLDRSFLNELGADIESATALRSLTGMIRPLGVAVVAKGVNTREQLAAVVSLNCDAAQGAIAGPPARAADLEFKRCVFDTDNRAGAAADHDACATRR
jgi:diguanylate cyclase (GGDEF)-like protein